MALNLAIPTEEVDDLGLSGIEEQMRDLLRKPRSTHPQANIHPEAERDRSGVEKMSAASIEQIDVVVGDLHDMRNALLEDANRVQSEIAAYTELSKSALGAARKVRTTLSDWNHPEDRLPARMAR